jgi:hypothetical protein
VSYLAALFSAWHLHAQALHEHFAALLVLAGLEIGRYIFDFVKFRREVSYHMGSSKLWGTCLFVGCFALLALDMSRHRSSDRDLYRYRRRYRRSCDFGNSSRMEDGCAVVRARFALARHEYMNSAVE